MIVAANDDDDMSDDGEMSLRTELDSHVNMVVVGCPESISDTSMASENRCPYTDKPYALIARKAWSVP